MKTKQKYKLKEFKINGKEKTLPRIAANIILASAMIFAIVFITAVFLLSVPIFTAFAVWIIIISLMIGVMGLFGKQKKPSGNITSLIG